MTKSEPGATRISAGHAWSPGVRARLLLAFFGIAAFAALAAAAGIYAFGEVGERLKVVNARVPPTLSAFELSRSAERIIAVAPALLAATDRTRRDEVRAELASEVERLRGELRDLKADGTNALPLETIEAVVSSLTTSLEDLDGLVGRRLETGERIAASRRAVFRIRDETQRLLAPWLQVMESEIARFARTPDAARTGAPGQARRLAPLIERQRLTQAAQRQISHFADIMADASTTERADRLPVLEFQLGLTLRDLEATSAGLDPRLRPLFRERVAEFREFLEKPRSIVDARRRELALVGEGQRRLADTTELSARLTAAVDRLGTAARQDIGEAARDALDLQRTSARALILVVALSLVTSVLIVWLYVGGNIVRRLTAVSDGMRAIAGGRLRTPVAVQGSDEIAEMAEEVEVFRRNAIELERLLAERKKTAARLEKRIDERTRDLRDKSRQLEIANKYKSHFLASASHDLRQPLHALNLFVAQLHAERDPSERGRLIGRIDAAVTGINELFESLLDMSKLEAGVLDPHIADFPLERTFRRIETTFAGDAGQHGLRLSVVPSSAWVRSDPVLFERIVMNLVSNAVHCTSRGGVVVGCRRRGGCLRIDVCDSGPGIPPEHQRTIFGEYRRCDAAGVAMGPESSGGFGLGLAIVERLGRLLNHKVALESQPGRGSRFSVWVPVVAEPCGSAETTTARALADPALGKLVVVIDDDPLVLDAMGGLLRRWGCRLVAAESAETAVAAAADHGRCPDLVISDYRLADRTTGIEAIEKLRNEFGAAIPAFLISGDTAPERLRDAREHGMHLLHKPVPPLRLRAMVNRLLGSGEASGTAASAAE